MTEEEWEKWTDSVSFPTPTSEFEWEVCPRPRPLLSVLRTVNTGQQSERKLRLFAAFCTREYIRLHPDQPGRVVVRWAEVSERYADGVASAEEWDRVRRSIHGRSHAIDPILHAYCEAEGAGGIASYRRVAWERSNEDEAREYQFLARMLRDIFGNPFRPVAFDPAWRSEAVVGIASGIYEERAFERLPILADALQEAGCEHPDILSHCREPGEHVRGCWVVDLVLGKE
jgi:hypothetical protein